MYRKFHRAIGMIFFVSYCACAGAARDVSQLHLHSNTGDWSLGTGFLLDFFVMAIEPEIAIAHPQSGLQYHFRTDFYE